MITKKNQLKMYIICTKVKKKKLPMQNTGATKNIQTKQKNSISCSLCTDFCIFGFLFYIFFCYIYIYILPWTDCLKTEYENFPVSCTPIFDNLHFRLKTNAILEILWFDSLLLLIFNAHC